MLTISETPLRRVITRGSARVNGFFASLKSSTALVWESHNEFNLLRILEIDPAVQALRVQAVCMKVLMHGEVRLHYPDIAALTPGGWELYEVKSDRDLDNREVFELAAAAAAVEVHGTAKSETYPEPRPVTYTLVFEHSLKEEPLATSVRTVALQLYRKVSKECEIRTVDLLCRLGSSLPLAELVDRSAPFGATNEKILSMVARGVLRVDLRTRLSPESLVWTPDQYPFGPRIIDLARARP